LSTGLRSIATAAFLALVAFAFYTIGIGDQPLTPAELDVVRLAQGPASLFFMAGEGQWLPPLAVYATSMAAAVSAGEVAGRLAAAAVGGLNVGLMFLLVRRRLASTYAGTGAALLLFATPAHIAFARTGVDAIYPLPFVLVWLMALHVFLEGGDRRFAASGAFALGVGVYSTASAPLTMSFLLAATLATIWWSGRRDLASFVVPIAGFAAPLGAAAIWFLGNPHAYPDTFGRWAIHAAHLRSPLDLARALVNWNTLGTRASIYWSFFDPSWLFFDGPSAPASTLRGAAPLLFATAIALVAGIVGHVRARLTPSAFLLATGLVIAPLAASTFGEPQAIGSALVMVPVVVVLAADGLSNWMRRGGWPRWLALGVIAALLIEVVWFLAS
jgi:hypothetical protein